MNSESVQSGSSFEKWLLIFFVHAISRCKYCSTFLGFKFNEWGENQRSEQNSIHSLLLKCQVQYELQFGCCNNQQSIAKRSVEECILVVSCQASTSIDFMYLQIQHREDYWNAKLESFFLRYFLLCLLWQLPNLLSYLGSGCKKMAHCCWHSLASFALLLVKNEQG